MGTRAGNPLVSVVIPAYQAERFLAEAIESTRSQTYQPLEVIVVDDGSTDGTAAVAGRFPEVTCVRLGTNHGLPAARNAGIEISRGEFIAFVDSDDAMFPQFVEITVGYLLEHPRCTGVLARQQHVFEPGSRRPSGEPTVDREGRPVLIVSAPVIRAEALRSVGGYDTSFRATEDLDLIIRLEAAGYEIDFLDDVLIWRRFHGANMSYDRKLLQRGLLQSVHNQIKRERERRDRPPLTD
jgi:glycosyltransferase involved in cell wall biosynthesis